MPPTLAALVADDGEAVLHGFGDRGRAPIAFERGIEHGAKPVENDGLTNLREDAGVDDCVVVGVAGDGGKGAAGHKNDAAIGGFDSFALIEVSAGDVVESVVGGGAGGRCPRRSKRSAPRALAAAVLRRMSSWASDQSRPIPRCAVSMASATPKPRDQR